MTSSVEKHIDFLKLLATTHKKQRIQLLHTISGSQLDVLVETVYNILNGVCPLTKTEEQSLKKKRKVVDKKLSNRIKQKIFLRIQRIIPTFLSSVLRYLSSNGKRSGASSKRKISKVT